MPPERVAVPSDEVPSKNVIVPVGTVVPFEAVTLAFRVTSELTSVMPVEAEMDVMVSMTGAETEMDTAEDMEGLNADVPAYDAVIVPVPTGSVEVVIAAIPAVSCAVPMAEVPL